jgi:hypothetical protein
MFLQTHIIIPVNMKQYFDYSSDYKLFTHVFKKYKIYSWKFKF